MAGGGANREADDVAFLIEAVRSLFTSRLGLPLLIALLLPPAVDLLTLSNLPTHDDPDHGPLLAAIACAAIAHSVLAVAILRILNGSPRAAWTLDSSACTYMLIVLGSIVVGIFADWMIDPSTLLSGLANEIVSTVIFVPLAPGSWRSPSSGPWHGSPIAGSGGSARGFPRCSSGTS